MTLLLEILSVDMLIAIEDIISVVNAIKQDNRTIVFTNGCFDIIHPGHTLYLKSAKSYGDILIVGLNSDDSVRRLKGNERPLNNQYDRVEVLDSLKPVDYVVIFNEDTPFNLISMIKPHILVKGGDYMKEDIVGADIVEQNNGQVIIIPFIEGKSTTSLIDKIKKL